MRFLLIICSIIIGLASCGQSKFTVTNSYGFFRQNSRGTIPVDDNNNPVVSGPDSQYVVYVETPSAKGIEWSKAWINNQTFDIFATKVNTPVVVGNKHASDQPIEVNIQPGNNLWQLNLQKGSNEQIPAKYKSSASINSIIVRGKLGKQDVYVIVNSLIELTPVIYP